MAKANSTPQRQLAPTPKVFTAHPFLDIAIFDRYWTHLDQSYRCYAEVAHVGDSRATLGYVEAATKEKHLHFIHYDLKYW